MIGALPLTIGSFEPPDAGQSVTPSLAPMLSRVNPVRGKSNDEQDDTLSDELDRPWLHKRENRQKVDFGSLSCP